MGNFKMKLSRLRVLLAKRINRILLGKPAGDVPSTILGSIEATLVNPEVEKHVEEIISFADPLIENYHFPESYPVYFRRTKAFEKRNVYLLRDVYVSPWSGLTWFNEEYILLESVGSLNRFTGWGNLLHELMLPKKRMQVPEYVVGCPPKPFYHWLFEVVPSILFALEIKSETKILISDNCPSYFKDFVRLITGEKDFPERVVVANHVVNIPRYILLQHEQDAGFIHPFSITLLRQFRDKVLRQSKLEPYASSPYIYISRKKTVSRRLFNEEELEEALLTLGFAIIYSEELSCEQQIVTYSRAKCIVASHGAGMSHMIWASEKVKILEIYAHNHFNDCYARIAMNLGFDHDYINCLEKEGTFGQILVPEVVEKIKMFDLPENPSSEQPTIIRSPQRVMPVQKTARKEPPVEF
jgi:hypothetical protein